MTEQSKEDDARDARHRAVFAIVAPIVAAADTAFRELLEGSGYTNEVLAHIEEAAARFAEPVEHARAFSARIRILLAHAQAVMWSSAEVSTNVAAAFAPERPPWPNLWSVTSGQGGEGGAYCASPAWEGECDRIRLREYERRRLAAQGRDLVEVEREKNTPKEDTLAIMELAGLGSLGEGVAISVLGISAMGREKP